MTDNYNSAQVKKTLKVITDIFSRNNVEYRLMGSIISTAINGELYRRVNDLDILVEKSKLPIVLDEFRQAGFYKKNKNNFRVSENLGLYVFHHQTLLETGFFAVNFKDGHISYKAGPIKFLIQKEAVIKTKYTFKGIKFLGIPPEVAHLLSSYSKDNPKRKKEFLIYDRNNINAYSSRPYETFLFGLRINWAINLLNWALVILGKLRVLIGKTYDPWR